MEVIKITANSPDIWDEVFLVSLEKMDGSEVQMAGIIEDLNFDLGDKPMEGIAIANGGRLRSHIPQDDEMITLKVYEVDAKLTGKGLVQFFHPQITADATDPILVLNTRTRAVHQVIVSWAENLSTYSTAGQISTADKAAYRLTAKNVEIVGYKPGNDDKKFSAEITLKWTPFGRDGYSNKKQESTATTAIPAKTAFTTANQYSAYS